MSSSWLCPRCGSVRTLDVTKGGPGTPACATCQTPMEQRVEPEPALIPGMAEALARIDREN